MSQKDSEMEEIRRLLDTAENKIRQAKSILFDSKINKKAVMVEEPSEEDVVQGVFDGQEMVGPDKKKYQVPANYASKSKLIPGDLLKLTIMPDGRYLYKQIGPVERKNLIGDLEKIDESSWQVSVDGKKYNVLLASVTYFDAKPGDKMSIVVPAEEESEWAAVDNKIS